VTHPAIRDPRSYLLRTATNVWIDTLRRRETEARGRPLVRDAVPAAGDDPATASDYEGEPIVLQLATRWGSEALEVVFRFEERDGRIARLRAYGFCPETMSAIGEALGLPVRTGLYRAPTPAPGMPWPEPAE
jgi:hypothetical protein